MLKKEQVMHVEHDNLMQELSNIEKRFWSEWANNLR